MVDQSNKQQRFDAAFEQIAVIIRKEQHNDASLIRMISGMALANPAFAADFGAHVANILDLQEQEVDYTDVVIEAYRTSLFISSETGFFGGDPDKAEEFVHALVTMAGSATAETSLVAATRLLH